MILSIGLVSVLGDRDENDRFICRDLTTSDDPVCIIANEREEKPLVFNGIVYDRETVVYDPHIYGNDRKVGCYFVNTIIFEDCSLNFIPTEIFKSCYKIGKLKFSNCSLISINNYMFQGDKSSHLEILILSNNLIRDIGSYTFDSLENLLFLNISHNKINHISQHSFHGLVNLKQMDLSNNEIKTIEKSSFSDLTSLELLNLSNNYILELFPDEFINIKYLYLANNNVSTFTCFASTLHEARVLIDLSNNFISELLEPQNCDYHNTILSNNKITSLIVNEYCISLEANNNNISHIEFSENVEEISLSKNNITNLTAFSQLKKLKNLNLSFNKIGKLDSYLSQLLNLEELFLENSGIHSIDFHTFSNQQNLKVLDISYNNFGNFDFNTLFALSDLNELFIDGNDLKELDFKAISENLSNLKIIGISNNDWNCSYLVKIIQNMNSKKIKIHVDPEMYITNSSSLKGISCVKGEKHQSNIVIWDTFKLPSHTHAEPPSNESENFKKQFDMFKENSEKNILKLKSDFVSQKLEMEKQINEQKQMLLDLKTELELKNFKNISNFTSDASGFVKLVNISNEKLQILFDKIDHLQKSVDIKENSINEPNMVKFDFLKNSQNNESKLNSKMNSLNILLVFTFVLSLSLVIFKMITFIKNRRFMKKRLSIGSSISPINEHSI